MKDIWDRLDSGDFLTNLLELLKFLKRKIVLLITVHHDYYEKEASNFFFLQVQFAIVTMLAESWIIDTSIDLRSRFKKEAARDI